MAKLDFSVDIKHINELSNALVKLRRCMEETEAAAHYVNEKWREFPPEIRGKANKLVTFEVAFGGTAETNE